MFKWLQKILPTSVPKITHELLLELGGKPIKGLKRCENCGLSETYWDYFPNCT